MNRVERVESLGVTFTRDYTYEGEGADRRRVELDIITDVHPGLTAEQWCALAMREGDAYVGGCCANMSAVQDRINAAFRDGGMFRAQDFIDIGEACREHDNEWFDDIDDDMFEQRAAAVERIRADGRTVDPWAILALTFQAAGPLLKADTMQAPRTRYSTPGSRETDEAFRVEALARTLENASLSDLFAPEEPCRSQWTSDEAYEAARQRYAAHKPQHDAATLLRRAKILSQLDLLRQELARHGGDVFEGVAIVEPDSDEIFINGQGPCIFATREQADRVIDIWRQVHDEMPAHEIVRVTVSLDDGAVVHRR